MYIICTKDTKKKSAKFYLIISTVITFHTQFKERTVVSNSSDIIFN